MACFQLFFFASLLTVFLCVLWPLCLLHISEAPFWQRQSHPPSERNKVTATWRLWDMAQKHKTEHSLSPTQHMRALQSPPDPPWHHPVQLLNNWLFIINISPDCYSFCPWTVTTTILKRKAKHQCHFLLFSRLHSLLVSSILFLLFFLIFFFDVSLIKNN